MAEARQSLRAIFDEVSEMAPGEQRQAYLDQACGGDTALRANIEELLRTKESAGGFLADPERHPLVATAQVTEQAGTMIGRYKLLEKIGEGGMGVVYMAEQEEPVRRRVALKIIKLGMDTESVIAHFEAERQALALMDHPNIAKVLDGGATETGRPYFVMELVQGVPITEFCDKNHLPTQERIKLFIQVCQAIQSAHQKGIIHRDIKPTNILVTLNAGVPVPMVIDFGVAKATQQKLTEKTVFTNYATMIGTPAYMSPEQAEMSRLDVDTRSDIYGLGVLLYELLTGSTPFPEKRLRSASYKEMQRIILEEEPERPSTRLRRASITASRPNSQFLILNSQFSIDLDWIVMKCLEKDRARRYETANGLAADLKRHLDNEPVVARPPSAAYRLQKAWRRNKTAFVATALMAGVLVTATGVSAWQAVRATRAEKLAAGRLIESENARKEAEAISKFLTEVFQSPDPAHDGRTITVVETLSNAVKKLDTDLTNQPAQRAKLQATLGDTYYALGLYREAISLREKVRDYYLATSGPERPDTLSAMHNLASSYGDAGERDKAINLGEQVLALRRKVLGPQHRDTLRTMNNLANFYDYAGRRDEALKLREQVLALRREVLGPEHPDTFGAMNNLGNSYDQVGRWEDALKLQEEVLAFRRKVLGPERPDTIGAMNNLANSYNGAGRHDEALKLREQVLVLRSRVNGPEHPDTLRAMRNLADSYDSYDQAGYRDEALKLREQVLALRRKVLGPEHPDMVNAIQSLADSYFEAGRQEEGLKLREQVLELRRKVLGAEHPDTLGAMNDLANSYFRAGRISEAIALMGQAGALDPKRTDASLTFATWQTWFGQDSEYEATRRRLVQQAEGTDQTTTAERAAKVACLRPSTDATLLAKALSLAQRAVELGKGNPDLPWYQLSLGLAEYRNGQYAAAEGALTVADQTAGGNGKHEIQGTARLFRAMSLFRQGKPEEARKLFIQADAQMPPLANDESNHDVLIWWLANKEAKALIAGPSAPVGP